MGRLEDKAFRLRDEIDALRRDEAKLAAELAEHRSLHDDGRRDAIVGNADDRAYWAEIKADLPRFEKALEKTRERIAKREADLEKVIEKLSR